MEADPEGVGTLYVDGHVRVYHGKNKLPSPNGQDIKMMIAERGTYIGEKGKGLWVREIRKLTETGHQTAMVSTEYRAEVHSLAVQMFSRWCQENFFRYMLQHFDLDSVAGYGQEPVDETKTVVNPAYKKIEYLVKSKAGKLGRKLREFTEFTLNLIPPPEDVLQYEAQKGALMEEIDLLKNDLATLKETRKATDKHIPVSKLPEADRFAVLAPRRKAFIDTIKMIAYRAETAMSVLLRESMARPDDASSLLRDIYTQEADIIPDEEEETLTVRLHHLTNRMSDHAARQLAQHLNDTDTIYPGTNLRLRYELVS